MSNIGYDDTPFLPEPYSQWRVHDGQRPQPTIVTPGATSADAPSDAVILFDGTDLSGWQTTSGGQPEWIVENGYMQVTPRTGDIVTNLTEDIDATQRTFTVDDTTNVKDEFYIVIDNEEMLVKSISSSVLFISIPSLLARLLA